MHFSPVPIWLIDEPSLEKPTTSYINTKFSYFSYYSFVNILKFNRSFINRLVLLLSIVSLVRLYSFWLVGEMREVFFIDFQLANFNFIRINFVIIRDLSRIRFIARVSLIRVAVLKFRETYIRADPFFYRFHFLLISFIFSIYFLILSPNFISILLGWDGLGLSSYLLVIYYGSPKAYNSGIITALTNRLGDALILVRIAYVLKTGTWHIFFYSLEPIHVGVTLIIMLAATTKRAQIPFSAWLPAAIAAPTPVSSLVHSSTLVTAGVYLLIRHTSLFLTSHTSFYCAVVGRLTILIARVRALFEMDLKKIVALSTLRQLGVIILSLGLGAYTASFFHLLTHAFFKALLFLSTGSIIHSRNSHQDLRAMGRARKIIPLTGRFVLVSLLSLIGLPFISAFFSKELILELILINNLNTFIYFLIATGISLTALYSARFMYIGIVNFSKNEQVIFKSDEDQKLILRIIILRGPAILAGAFLQLVLFPTTELRSSPGGWKLGIVSLIFLGIIGSIFINKKLCIQSWHKLSWIRGGMWSLPIVRAQTPATLSSPSGITINKTLDRGIFIFLITSTEKVILRASGVTPPLLSLQKILRIRVVWGLLARLYYLCNKLHWAIKNNSLSPKFQTTRSNLHASPLTKRPLQEKVLATKVKSKKAMFK